jgi:hypothetical protein
MKLILITCILLYGCQSIASETKQGTPSFSIYREDPISTQKNVCQLYIHFNNPEFRRMHNESQYKIQISINDVLQTIVLDSTYSYSWELEPGNYQLKLWPGIGFEEIITDSLHLKRSMKYSAIAQFNPINNNVIVDKPVIYFSTDQETPFSLQVLPVGQFTFTYPNYLTGWNGRVQTNGSIDIHGQTYPYLFWESEQPYCFQPSTNGFHVRKERVTLFLEQKLNELGFTSKEKTDFITFWGPKLIQKEELFIQFEFGAECERYATLVCNPVPKNIHRVYISYCTWDEAMAPYLKDEQFLPLNREGFTLLEWGGHAFELHQFF